MKRLFVWRSPVLRVSCLDVEFDIRISSLILGGLRQLNGSSSSMLLPFHRAPFEVYHEKKSQVYTLCE